MKLTIHFHPMQRLRMQGDIHNPYHTPYWCGAKLNTGTTLLSFHASALGNAFFVTTHISLLFLLI
jgi:hypothetical protein